jgi:cytidine deaminase
MSSNKDIKNNSLVKAAVEARKAAYAPYSKFAVGVALLSKGGQVFKACNVENISLGLTICAERSAVAAAVAAGEKDFQAIAIVTNSKKPALPCGACRQVLAEFSPTMTIIAATTSGESEEFHLGELLPKPTQGILESDRNV